MSFQKETLSTVPGGRSLSLAFICLLALGLAAAGCDRKPSAEAPRAKSETPSDRVEKPAPPAPAPAGDSEKYFFEGNKYSTKGQFPEAIQAYKKSIQADASFPSVHYNLGNVYVATGKTEEAVQEYLAAIKLNPLDPEYRRNLGFAYAVMRQGDLARNQHEELKKMSPAHAEELMTWINRENQKSGKPVPGGPGANE
ncbi:MAG: tetratricopeptide repeat protein [Nitrospinae bacterium]|nr:tetratricopeptide repeat protein [Nitrospinota bacterium]